MIEEKKAASTSTEMVTIKIDGNEVTVPKGTNLLEACLQQGNDISYFCYHAGLSSPAVCRQCLVEVVGQPKLVPSCYTPATDKMEVVTQSERVQKARAQMLEFTLVNHPVDCPICDKAGECTLQKLYMEWDGAESRVEFDKVHKPKVVDLGPTIVLDAERCILCTRCIRVCDEVAGVHQLEMSYRGDHEVLTVAPGQVLDNPYSLNTVDVCPVGALTSKDFRFRMRAWELYTTPSICPGCSTGCNIEIHHHQGEAWRLVPRENQEVNKFWMCDEGRFTYKELRSKRLAGARIGVGKGLPGQLANAEKAATEAASRLNQVLEAKGSIGVVFGAQAQNEGLFLLRRVVEHLRQLGADVTCYVSGRKDRPERADRILRSADVNPNTQGARLFAGSQAKNFQELLKDLEQEKLKALWMIGEDVPLHEVEQSHLFQLLDRLKVFIVQAVHHTPLVERAHIRLPTTAWAEVDGTFTNQTWRVQRTHKALSSAGDARSHLEWIGLIGKKAGWLKQGTLPASPKQAFLLMLEYMKRNTEDLTQEAEPLQSFLKADWGREIPPVKLRFANSRG